VTSFGEFSPIWLLLSFGSSLKIIEVSQILGFLATWLRVCINFDEKSIGLHFGRFFHKLIWSPCKYIHEPMAWPHFL
jgi:hypothetical protein